MKGNGIKQKDEKFKSEMLTDPYLNAFRGIIPAIGGLDLSPILAFIVLNLIEGLLKTTGQIALNILSDKVSDIFLILSNFRIL